MNKLKYLQREFEKEIDKYEREQYAERLWNKWTTPISNRNRSGWEK